MRHITTLIILSILLTGCQKKEKVSFKEKLWTLDQYKKISCTGKYCVEEKKKGCEIEYRGYTHIDKKFSLLLVRYETCKKKTVKTYVERINKADYKVTSKTIVVKDKKYKIHKLTSDKFVLVRKEGKINHWYFFEVLT